MSPKDIIRAWKDEEYLSSLSPSEQAGLPEDPAGAIELSDNDLGEVGGALSTLPCVTLTITVSLGVSQVFGCGPSILHGTCSGYSYGCC